MLVSLLFIDFILMRDFTRAINIDSDFASAYNNRGEAWYKKGDLKSAESDYRQALKINPAFEEVFYNRGKLRLKNGDKAGAIADLKKTLKIDPDFSKAYNLLSRLLKSSSKNVDARHKKRLLTREGD